MRVLDKAIFVEAHRKNFNQSPRSRSSIKWIVAHYTGNIGDTARNNAVYFRDNAVESSAHFFVSEESIYQSVPENHAAYSVGLGNRTTTYIPNPPMYITITNSNSISVEICGSKDSREGTETTKRTAAKLIADLLEKYNLSPSCVYRHYDVTGKRCPAWAVEDPLKWLEFTLMISNYFYGEGEDEMTDSPENYNMFKTFMERYEAEKAQTSCEWADSAMNYCKARGLINDGRPNSTVTRAELATVLMRINA